MSSSTVLADVPLFPLHTVLFPDGLLPLKIFEARYLDMARECLREKTPFGVCLLKSGAEVLERIIATIRERDPDSLPFAEPF
ncbi:MAG: LON peptidase substrate-binding domain-containing protein, partial [Paraburkholderia nemoris]